ncbi:MAG TPA: hypothetical protein VK912_07105 [Longimicrobiales bacterium]|nr:hypothetical protein [Longimicrobiales bacterium]
MRRLAEDAWFLLGLTLGRMLRSARYAHVRISDLDGMHVVLKRRRFYAPVLVAMGNPLLRLLNAGVRILPHSEWHERELGMYRELHNDSIRIESDGTLVLPFLPGIPLATVLENEQLDESNRLLTIERAVVALAEFHHRGFTHGDAMAENVMIDGAAGAAQWFDFETVHDPRRAMVWRRADDVRALLATCLLRTARAELARTLHHVLDVYADEDVARLVAASFGSVWQRPLVFHLGQAGLSLERYREIRRLLTARVA